MSSHDILTTADSTKWEEAQKRAFTHWVNSMLKRRQLAIDDIMSGFQSGVNLINLVEILTGKAVQQRWAKQPTLRVHKINNCFMGLAHLKEHNVKNLTVAAEDFVNGDRVNMILGFCWQLLRHFQEPPPQGDEEGILSFEQGLLAWVKNMLKNYDDINLNNGFKSESFKNGKVILGLINEYGEGLVDYKAYGLDKSSYVENCRAAFDIAEAKMGIPSIIDYTDLAAGACSEKQLVLYLSLMYNAYKEKNLGMSTENLVKRVKELEEKLRVLTEENIQLKEALKHIDLSHANLTSSVAESTERKNKLVVQRDELSSKYSTLEESYDADKLKWERELARLKAEKAKLAANSDSAVTALNAQWDAIQASRDQLREEFRKAKEELSRQREELESEQKKLLSKLDRATKTKEGLEQIINQTAESHRVTIEVLRKHTLQHVVDTNRWVPILEAERSYKHHEVKVPRESDFAKQEFSAQLVGLTKIMAEENKSFSALLREREIEEAEVLSVNMGKLKKRFKKPAPGQKVHEEDTGPARPAGGPSGKTPRNDAKPSSPRPRPEKSAPKKGK